VGWFEDAVSSVGRAFSDAAQGIVDVVNAVGDAISDVVSSVGHAIQDVFDWIGGGFDSIGWTGVGAIFHWVGSVIGAFFNFIADIVKSVFSILAGVIVLVVIGPVALASGNVKALEKVGALFLSGLTGGLLMYLASAIIYVQTVLPVHQTRRLTDEERETLRAVFSGSLALFNIRVIVGSGGLFDLNGGRQLTVGNTIYLKGAGLDVLVHEATHCWQYQHMGSSYVTEALGAQISSGPGAYSWRADFAAGKTTWSVFNVEAQAAFVEQVYTSGTSSTVSGAGAFYRDDGNSNSFLDTDSANFTKFANATVSYIRSRTNVRISTFF
jgi:predicted membrane channel-forming protein YqfA (hemolysin III family)